MKCFECVLKHLSKALSYGKEVMGGHDRNNALDHRPDLLGEIGNAEDHLKLIDDALFAKMKAFRSELQSNQVSVTIDTLQTIRDLYKEVENMAYGSVTPVTNIVKIEDTPDILFPVITNLEWFKSAFQSLVKLGNYNKIFYVSSSVDLTGFEIQKYEAGALKENVLVWNEQTVLLKNVDAREFPRLNDNKKGFNFSRIASELHPTGAMYFYGALPMLMTLKNMQPIASDLQSVTDWETTMTLYGNKYPQAHAYRAFDVCVSTDKAVCCSDKSRLKTCMLAHWVNDTAYQSIASLTT